MLRTLEILSVRSTVALAAVAMTPACESTDLPPELGTEARTPIPPPGPPGGDAGAAAESGAVGPGAPRQPMSDAGASLCDPAARWTVRTRIALSSPDDDDLFGSVTPDELTIAWTTSSGSRVRVWWADRLSPSDPFGTPRELTTSFAYAFDRASLSVDGLQLAVLDPTRKIIQSFFRPGRDIPFARSAGCGGCASGGFDLLNAQASTFGKGETFAGILTADARTLYYSRIGASREDTTWLSSRTTQEQWPVGDLWRDPALARKNDENKVPTGVSTDDRTVFFFDEETNRQYVGWRPAPRRPLDGIVDLGRMRGAQPNASCARIYFTADGPSSLDLFVGADR